MKVLIVILSLTSLVINSCQSKAQVLHSRNLIVEATVEKIGKRPIGTSGFLAVYQLAKYKVTSVCNSEYDKKEIVVDHLIMTGNELEDLQPGDRIRLEIQKSPTIFVRNDEDGFRKASEKIEMFYIGAKPQLVSSNCSPCEPC